MVRSQLKSLHPLFMGVAALLVVGVCSPAAAFHSGGTGQCEGCHTIHNSFEGASVGVGSIGQANAFLLRGTDQSSTCLNCHNSASPGASGYHVSTDGSLLSPGVPPSQLTPGGDFAWLKKSYAWTVDGGEGKSSPGERHGHNIVAVDFDYRSDNTLAVAPGGAYPTASLHCSSCHDPHGRYRLVSNGVQAVSGKPIKGSGSYGTEPDDTFAVGVYRLLAGTGYKPKSLQGGITFSYEAMYAVAPEVYNRTEDTSDTRVAYGKGGSEWCANCHPALHGGLGSGFGHPVGVDFGVEIAANYNAYKKSGDLTGIQARAYTSLVPFQIGNSTDSAQLKDAAASTAGPAMNDKVACLSCHRAHASGWDSSFRYNHKTTFMTVLSGGVAAWPDPTVNPTEAQGRSREETSKAYYDRPATLFAPMQRTLCNKCHAKD